MNRKLRDKLILVATCLMLLWCVPSFGQVLKGSISGTAVDQNGAVVPGAQVKATNTGTSAVLTTTTDNSGTFRFNLIPAGDYKIEISAQHFKTAVQNGVAVSAGRDSGLGQVRLSVGEASTTVEVTADAPLIETTQAQVTNTFSGVQLSTFAGVQENQGLDNLAVFVPGVSSSRDNNFSNTNGGGGFSSNGLRGRNNDQQIDGQNNNDNSVGGPGLFVSDAEFVSQYVLITNQFGPEYGRNAGSVVNIITKSGTNAWHGSVFGAENNSILNSLNNFDKNPDICGTGPDSSCLKKPNRLNDEFGGFTIGGPWIKNKLFFFGGFDQELVSQKASFTSQLLTPTPAGIATMSACFPGSASLQALSKFGPYAISGGDPHPLNPVTPTSALDPNGGSAFIAACPGVQFGGVGRTISQPDHIFDWIIKQDLQLGNDTITGRYIFNRNNFFNASDNGAAGYFFNVPALSQAALISWTHNLSAHMVNEARVSFGRLNVEFGGSSVSGAASPVAGQLDQAPANVIFSTAAQSLGFGPATNLPQQRIVNTWQAQDNWNWVLGKHQLKAGVNWTYQRSPNIFLPNINGAYRFSNWGKFATDQPNRIRIAAGPSLLDFREYDTFLYGGDDWKITQNLTLQLGLTWSYYGQPANLFNNVTVPRESSASTALWATTEPAGAPDALGNTFSNPGASIPLSARTEPTIPAPKNSFGPAVGFVYSPQWGGFLTGHGKTTFRGGYRMLYDPPFYNIYLNISTSAPMTFLNTVPSPATHPLPGNPIGPNVRSSLASAIQTGVFDPREFAQTHVTPDFGPDKVHTWSFGFERELGKNAAVEARYVGNHAYNLFQTLDGNPFIADLKRDFPNLVPAGLTPCTTPLFTNSTGTFNDPNGRLDCTQGVVRTRSNTGFSNYNAAQVEFRANNLFKQLTFRTSYTFSKTLDNVSEIFSTFGGGNSVFFAQNPAQQVTGAGEYSFSGLDYPHQWSILLTEQLPFFKEQHGLTGHILGGWTISANYLVASGQRYSPIQAGAEAASTANGDYYDFGYILNFAGVDTAHPFLGNLNAPATAVGIMCADALGAGGCGPTGDATILSLNALNKTGDVVTVSKDQVRFIINALESQTVFGTPFGNTPRNPVTNAISNIGNLSIFKNIKLGEHANFEFHTTFLNVLNHSNYASVDAVLEDAGLTGAFTGFGDPTQTPSVSNGAPPTRRIIFGGKVTF